MAKMRIKKLINTPLIQVSFMYVLKISAIKSIKFSVTTIVKITDRNAGMQNVLHCQIASIRERSAKLFKNYSWSKTENANATIELRIFKLV